MELRHANTLYKLDVSSAYILTYILGSENWQTMGKAICAKNNKGPSIVQLRIRKVEAQLLQGKPLTQHFIFAWDVISIGKKLIGSSFEST